MGAAKLFVWASVDGAVCTDRYFVWGSGEALCGQAHTVCRAVAVYTQHHLQPPLYLDPVWSQKLAAGKYRHTTRPRDYHLAHDRHISVREMDHLDASAISAVGTLCDDTPAHDYVLELQIIYLGSK